MATICNALTCMSAIWTILTKEEGIGGSVGSAVVEATNYNAYALKESKSVDAAISAAS